MLKAMAFLHHRCQIIHTDLKPENVLLTRSFITMPTLDITPDMMAAEIAQKVKEQMRLDKNKMGQFYEDATRDFIAKRAMDPMPSDFDPCIVKGIGGGDGAKGSSSGGHPPPLLQHCPPPLMQWCLRSPRQ